MAELVQVEVGDGSAGSPLGVATIRLTRPPMTWYFDQAKAPTEDCHSGCSRRFNWFIPAT